ncbi:putative chemoreceptor glutamine deamidase CheD 1 [Thiomicrorhabdus immobilis]|uniref:Probable chemoreceptor glutamine deamidase CheD n=1 Tax=Thiomicrorhabdus immobilis TaxID=2791037 RepID=A0ABN6CVG3_9GAMM|nr:chemoreceptor glutamine deamidase CheD [Thiomicrorhabdus immobilis]BCN92898.1 putative chemoreceptor glutamine deamidase CheD 1 [Thiomicrorhabdus immobilis]
MQKNIDPAEGITTVKILPGEFYVTKDNERIETILGSCISACVRDPIAGVGGMNHFMLPVDKSNNRGTELSDANRYGNYAMENLVNALLSQGAKRERLEFKLFGGGRIMSSMTNVGWYNIGFAFDYIYTEGFKIVSQDIGDIYPRKVLYYPITGRVRVRRLNAMHNQSLADEENRYINKIESKPVEGDVELF